MKCTVRFVLQEATLTYTDFITAFTMEQEIPDYDMDSDDERWLQAQKPRLDLSPLKVLVTYFLVSFVLTYFC